MKKNTTHHLHSRRHFIKLATASTALFYPLMPDGKIASLIHPNNDQDQFLLACQNGDLTTVKDLLLENPTLIGAQDDTGRSCFAIALLAGHKEVGAFLKTAGFQTDLHESVLDLDWDRFKTLIGEVTAETQLSVNADHPIGGTVMWAAAAGGAGTQTWRVYANGGLPNINTRKEAGSTPLQKALQFPDLSKAEVTAAALLSNGASPNADKNGEMPALHLAAARGSYALVEMLIRLGADVAVKNEQGKTAIQTAAYFGHQQVYELLYHHQDIPRNCHSSRTAFQADGQPYQMPDMTDIPWQLLGSTVGQSHSNLEAVQKAITEDPRLAHSVTTTTEKAVEAGAHMGNQQIVSLLLQHGAPYSLPTAIMMSDYSSVKKMLQEDPLRIQERGAHDFALLWYPIIGQCDLDMTALLLAHGAHVEQQHFLGTTALHWACRKGDIALVELLLENGADINRLGRKFNEPGESPLQMTTNEKLANYLKSKGAK